MKYLHQKQKCNGLINKMKIKMYHINGYLIRSATLNYKKMFQTVLLHTTQKTFFLNKVQ